MHAYEIVIQMKLHEILNNLLHIVRSHAITIWLLWHIHFIAPVIDFMLRAN